MRSALATVESRCAITSTVKSFIILSRASWTTASLSESRALVACMWCGVIRCQTADSEESSTQLTPCQKNMRRVWFSIMKYCLVHPQGKRAVTSSNNSTVGFLTSALAMAMRCFCPPDSDTPFSPQSCMFIPFLLPCDRPYSQSMPCDPAKHPCPCHLKRGDNNMQHAQQFECRKKQCRMRSDGQPYCVIALRHGHDKVMRIGQTCSLLHILIGGYLLLRHPILHLQPIQDVSPHTPRKQHRLLRAHRCCSNCHTGQKVLKVWQRACSGAIPPSLALAQSLSKNTDSSASPGIAVKTGALQSRNSADNTPVQRGPLCA